MLWKALENWKYEYMAGDSPNEIFGEFAPLVKMWQHKKGDRKMPAWSDFDFVDFRGWHSRLAKSTVTTLKPLDWRIDIFGSEFREIYGGEWTGRQGSETFDAMLNPEEEAEFYQMIVDNGYISYVSGNIPWKGLEYKKIKLIELPLSNNGETVTHFIEFITGVDSKQLF